MQKDFSHLDLHGNAVMVDVSSKEYTAREAQAECKIYMKHDTIQKILDKKLPKGDVAAVSRIAGIMACKKTSDIIPMCHNIPIDSVKIEIVPFLEEGFIKISSYVKCTWKTGVEMEALTAVAGAALALYDMCKSVDKDMTISEMYLTKKTGGKSGEYVRGENYNV